MPDPTYSTLEDWVAREAIPFDLASRDELNSAIDRMVDVFGNSVELFGIGEPTHLWEQFPILRNRLFERLVEKHGYRAIAVESSFARGPIVDDYISGRRSGSYDSIIETGFSHGFGRMESSRALIEWMRQYNASHEVKLRFYGFDGPMEMTGAESPRGLLGVVFDYLQSIEPGLAAKRRQRLEGLLGDEAAWTNPAASFEPAKSIGRSPAATSLRIETDDLLNELRVRRPELTARTGRDSYEQAVRYAHHAGQMLTYHALMAGSSPTRIADMLGLRDLMMADNLAYIVDRERDRGKVLAFAHNSHLKRGQSHWQLGPHALSWWAAGAHVGETMGDRYAVLGVAAGTAQEKGLAVPEMGTLEGLLTPAARPACVIPTHRGRGLPTDASSKLLTRSTEKYPGYFPFTPQSIHEFDGLILLS